MTVSRSVRWCIFTQKATEREERMGWRPIHLSKTGLACLGALVMGGAVMVSTAQADELPPVFRTLAPIAVPSGAIAQEPSLATDGNSLVMSWMETGNLATKVRVARHRDGAWSKPATVAIGKDLFVNWADFPTVTAFGESGLAVHWLRKVGRSSFDYNVEIALSADGGETWSAPVIPHSDRSQAQHGFVAMSAAPDGMLDVLWLDGRAYGRVGLNPTPDAMQLRATRIAPDGSPGRDAVVDVQTCSCCQTSAARLDDGALVVAYRDRTDAEIRDISVVRQSAGLWADPVNVHADGWEISGCPVNGPAITALGQRVAVAWFTAAEDIPAVNLSFSTDGAATFDTPLRIDTGEPLGRVDAALLADGSALVTWLEWDGGDELLQVCRAVPGQGCIARQTVARNGTAGSMNFPRMAVVGAEVFLAWTQPMPDDTSSIGLWAGMLREPVLQWER